MQSNSERLLDFFIHTAKRDDNILEQLDQAGFDIDQENWKFHLTDLHHFLSQQYDSPLELSYQEFRKTLFDLPINQQIKPLGASITIHDNLNHVDQSCYVMTWVHK